MLFVGHAASVPNSHQTGTLATCPTTGEPMRRIFLPLTLMFLVPPTLVAGEKKIDLNLRSRVPEKTAAGREAYKILTQTQPWTPKGTAAIVVDMWDTHHCYNAV